MIAAAAHYTGTDIGPVATCLLALSPYAAITGLALAFRRKTAATKEAPAAEVQPEPEVQPREAEPFDSPYTAGR